MSVETLQQPHFSSQAKLSLPAMEPTADQLQVFDVALYARLFNQVGQKGLTKEEAKQVIVFAATNDGVGLVTEKVSGEQQKFGGYVFDVENRIRMQLTPTKHFYLQEEDEETGRLMMVAPEHKWGKFKKDALDLISDWRRGMDKVGMAGVRARFLDKSEDALKEGETIIWGSPKAEEWEGETVMRYNGQYGFLYVGRVVNLDGARALEVRDFKNDLDAAAYGSLFQSLEGEVCTNPLYIDHPLVDKVKASFVRSKKEWTIEAVWKELGEAQKEVTGVAEIFNLPVENILALQDPELHQRIRSEVAVPLGEWIADQIYQGSAAQVIQDQIRQKFIDGTVKLIFKIKAERFQDRWREEYQPADYVNKTIPFMVGITNAPDSAILTRYSGSSGNGCGSWGESGSGSGRIRSGSSSVAGLSGVFGSGGETGKKGKACISCGEVNYCTKKCYKCDGILV